MLRKCWSTTIFQLLFYVLFSFAIFVMVFPIYLIKLHPWSGSLILMKLNLEIFWTQHSKVCSGVYSRFFNDVIADWPYLNIVFYYQMIEQYVHLHFWFMVQLILSIANINLKTSYELYAMMVSSWKTYKVVSCTVQNKDSGECLHLETHHFSNYHDA